MGLGGSRAVSSTLTVESGETAALLVAAEEYCNAELEAQGVGAILGPVEQLDVLCSPRSGDGSREISHKCGSEAIVALSYALSGEAEHGSHRRAVGSVGASSTADPPTR